MLWASLATIALYEGHIRQMWLWLGIALLVDAVDGSIARAVRVTEYAPGFDGATLDNIVDYLTWTFIPALFMVFYLPFGSRGLGIAAALIVCCPSMFCYCNVSLEDTRPLLHGISGRLECRSRDYVDFPNRSGF